MQQAPPLTGATRVFGIIGCPVRHSLSPLMQNAAFQAAGIDAVYVPFPVDPEQLAQAVGGLRTLRVAGFNVTIPHKSAIMPFLDRLDHSAVAAGAVNVVMNHDGILTGYNTDGDGLILSLQRDLGCDPAGCRVVLVGAGGAARGALAALCRAGVAAVSVLNRTASAAEEMLATVTAGYPQVACTVLESGRSDQTFWQQQQLVINATSLGMKDEEIPGLELACLPGDAKVYDMVYAPPETRLLRAAKAMGLATANGLGMLVAQGELAFELWHGSASPAGVMAKALHRYLDSP